MMRKLMIPAFLLVTIMLINACNNQSDGGGCSYSKDTLPATLVKLVDINPQRYDLLFEVEIDGKKDTVPYSEKNNGHYLLIDEIPKDSIKTGIQYQYIVQKIITGTCEPQFELIRLQPFTLDR